MKNSKTILSLYLAVCSLFMLSAQTTYTVDNNPDGLGDFTELQAAVDAASDGDVIYIQPSSTNYDGAEVDKSLTIVGRSHSLVSYKAYLSHIYLATGSSGSTIKGLNLGSIQIGLTTGSSGDIEDITVIDNKLESTIYIGNSSTQPVNNVLIRGNQLNGSNYLYDYATNIILTNNIFTGRDYLIYATHPNSTLVSNNIFKIQPYYQNFFAKPDEGTLNISNSIFICWTSTDGNIGFRNTNYQINNCLTYNYYNGRSLGFAENSQPTNIVSNTLLNTDPKFVQVDSEVSTNSSIAYSSNRLNPYYDDLHLASGSPAIGAGSSGADLGIYDGGFNFKPFGQPTGVPTLTIDAYSSNVPKNSTLDVAITAKAH